MNTNANEMNETTNETNNQIPQRRRSKQEKLLLREREWSNNLKNIIANLSNERDKKKFSPLLKAREVNAKQIDKILTKPPRKLNTSVNNSGFNKQYFNVDKGALKFLNKEDGSPVTQSELRAAIFAYIDQNNLRNPNKKSEIIPDATIKSALNYQGNDPLNSTDILRLVATQLGCRKM